MEQDNYVFPGQRFAQNGYCTGHGQGMTLRDWFAGQSLTGIDLDTCEPEKCAVWVYKIADAMMEARKK